MAKGKKGFANTGAASTNRKPVELEGPDMLRSRPHRGEGSGIGSAMPVKGTKPADMGKRKPKPR